MQPHAAVSIIYLAKKQQSQSRYGLMMRANLPWPGDGVGLCRLWRSSPIFLLKSVCPFLEWVPTLTDRTNLRLEHNSKT